MTKHYKYGGSTEHRTLNCHAWHRLSEHAPKLPAGPAAQLGTALHTIVEQCLNDTTKDPNEFVNQIIDGVLICDQHIDQKIWPALDAFEELMDTYEVDKYWCEITADIDDDTGGTADFFGVSEDGKTIVMADYKSGDGHMINPEENAQLLFYVMTLLYDRKKRFLKYFVKATTVVLAVVQPSERKSDVLEIWETDMQRVRDFADEHEAAVALSESDEAEPTTGPHCDYCPAAPFCPAKHDLVEEVQLLPADSLQLDQLTRALQIADELEKWVRDVRSTAHTLMEQGQQIEAFKLVAKRASRVWNDEAALVKKLKGMKKLKIEDAYNKKLMSPAQLETLLRAHDVAYAEIEEYVSLVSSGSTLVPATDPRPALEFSTGQRKIAERFAQ